MKIRKGHLSLMALLLMLCLINISCEDKNENSSTDCSIVFSSSNPYIVDCSCENVIYSNEVYDRYELLKSFDYQGCGEQGHVEIVRDDDGNISKFNQVCN